MHRPGTLVIFCTTVVLIAPAIRATQPWLPDDPESSISSALKDPAAPTSPEELALRERLAFAIDLTQIGRAHV